MKFGPVAVADASGTLLAHSVRLPSRTIRKGVRLGADEIAALLAGGVTEIVVARLDPDDVHEDEAAVTLARALAGEAVTVEPPFTGRSNLIASAAGVVTVDRAAIDALNRIDPAITVATKPAFAPVVAGELVATIKIIPFAVPRAMAARALAQAHPAVGVAPYRVRQVGLVATMLPSLKPSVMAKTRWLLDERLQPAGAAVMREERVAHDAGAVAAALREEVGEGAELAIVFGASAVVDEDDVIPAAIRQAGGEVTRLGMPVDPGNLLVLGRIGDVPVLGAPGCARSPRENGFDWVLHRLLAGLAVTSDDIAALGVGGLLMEIASRPQPREPSPPPRIGAIILAAGQSRRMGSNKMLATVGGKALVRRAAEAALASRAASVVVVTGHAGEAVAAALAGLDVRLVANPDYAEGMSTSLKAGIGALPSGMDGAIVLLADMPAVSAETIDRLLAAFRPGGAVVPVHDGRRGNPVVWSRRFFPDLLAVTGDKGGREVLAAAGKAVIEVPAGAEIALDVDTPEALAEAQGQPA